MVTQKSRLTLCIVTPALANANNGNWQTSKRWARILGGSYQVKLIPHWPHAQVSHADALIALHARRSAQSIAAWASQKPSSPLIVALTGTDLYRDIADDPQAQHSLQVAHRLIVLQEAATQELPEAFRPKTRVLFQSSTSRQTISKTRQHLRIVVAGHLRSEKSPQTVFHIARALEPANDILIDHIGDALEPQWAEAAIATSAVCPHYRWLGGLPHSAVRRHIQRAHLLLHPSQMEGGAHVIMEAITSGTPVLASGVAGNVGMLGAQYTGYFDWNNTAQAIALLRQCRHSLNMAPEDPKNLLAQLTAQCHQRAPLFAPAQEAWALQSLVAQTLASVSKNNP